MGMDVMDKDTRMWAMLCHLSALATYIGLPFGNIIGPLVVWMIKRETSPFVDDQGKEALNFNISMIIYGIVCAVLMLVVIGFFLLILLCIAHIVLTIIAAIKANNGETYRYPATIRFVK